MANIVETAPQTLLPSDDLDYAAAFAALCQVHSEIKQEGVCARLLLRRAHARFALGNYLAAAFDAERVAREHPEWVDAHYLKGQACLAMAAVRLGRARPGVGVYMPVEGLPPLAHLLNVARRAFQSVLDRNEDDRQAQRGLRLVDEWQSPSGGALTITV